MFLQADSRSEMACETCVLRGRGFVLRNVLAPRGMAMGKRQKLPLKDCTFPAACWTGKTARPQSQGVLPE